MKQQRNDICKCGSGLKYKKCCIKKISLISNGHTPKKKLTKDEKIALQLMNFGKKAINYKKDAIQKEISVPKGNQREANIKSSNKRIEE